MPQINTCSKYVLVYYYISAAVMMLPHFTELCIDNEYFRSGELPQEVATRNGNHAAAINEILEHRFFRFACFVFSIVAELKLLSGCLSSLRLQVLTVWSGGLSKFQITYEEEQNITKKTKLEP